MAGLRLISPECPVFVLGRLQVTRLSGRHARFLAEVMADNSRAFVLGCLGS